MALGFSTPPVGGKKRFLVRMDGNPWNSFDTRQEADAHIAMQMSKVNTNKGGPADAAKRQWTIDDRG